MIILLDIDNTLYSFAETGFHAVMYNRIIEYTSKSLGITKEEATQQCNEYYGSYGLSLHGFHKHGGLDANEYCDFVHQCDYSILKPAVSLRATLEQLKSTKQAQAGGPHDVYYFTNANSKHAKAVLEPLGLWDLFYGQPSSPSTQIPSDQLPYALGFSYEDQWRLSTPQFANKPMPAAYEVVFRALREGDKERGIIGAHPNLQPEEVIMVDDSIMNLEAPLSFGWKAVWVSFGAAVPPKLEAYITSGDLVVITSIDDLGSAIHTIGTALEQRRQTHSAKNNVEEK